MSQTGGSWERRVYRGMNRITDGKNSVARPLRAETPITYRVLPMGLRYTVNSGVVESSSYTIVERPTQWTTEQRLALSTNHSRLPIVGTTFVVASSPPSCRLTSAA